MFQWLNKLKKTHKTMGLTFTLMTAGIQRLNKTLQSSTHQDHLSLVKEALMVVETVYAEAIKNGREVTCRVENGKIAMYVTTDDDGEGEPLPIESDNVIQLFSKAA